MRGRSRFAPLICDRRSQINYHEQLFHRRDRLGLLLQVRECVNYHAIGYGSITAQAAMSLVHVEI